MVSAQCVRSAVTVVPCPGGFAPEGKGRFPQDNVELQLNGFMVWTLLVLFAVLFSVGALLRAIRNF